DQIAAAIGELDSDDAVYILEELDKEDREEILAQLPFTDRVRLRRALDYPESSAGRRMQTEFVAHVVDRLSHSPEWRHGDEFR
ncbi:magnesium transporter MgtE N-terminal domain-containing protein, partial [Rhizobium ruizarguesonis]